MRGGRHPCWSRSQKGLCVHECANGSVCVCVCVAWKVKSRVESVSSLLLKLMSVQF